MNKVNIYRWLAVTALFIGAGMVLGYSLGKNGSNSPMWIGSILVFFGAVLFGMAVGVDSSGRSKSKESKDSISSNQKSNS